MGDSGRSRKGRRETIHRKGRTSQIYQARRTVRMLPRRESAHSVLRRRYVRHVRVSGGMSIELRRRAVLREQEDTTTGVEGLAGVRRRREGERIEGVGARQAGRFLHRVRRSRHQEEIPRGRLCTIPEGADAVHHGVGQRRLHRRAEEGGDSPVHQPQLRAELQGRSVEGTGNLPRVRHRIAGRRRRRRIELRLSVDPKEGPRPHQMLLRIGTLPRYPRNAEGIDAGGRGDGNETIGSLESGAAGGRTGYHEPHHQGVVRGESGVLRRRRVQLRRQDGEAPRHIQVRSERELGGSRERDVDAIGRGGGEVRHCEEESAAPVVSALPPARFAPRFAVAAAHRHRYGSRPGGRGRRRVNPGQSQPGGRRWRCRRCRRKEGKIQKLRGGAHFREGGIAAPSRPPPLSESDAGSDQHGQGRSATVPSRRRGVLGRRFRDSRGGAGVEGID
mmetsp:Transcript_31149/g.93389  ORF Transcript_31149/g.93389 Transcript_31149/m.93389 type:complete len:446 (-) Transcript_31149:76-1413(-)